MREVHDVYAEQFQKGHEFTVHEYYEVNKDRITSKPSAEYELSKLADDGKLTCRKGISTGKYRRFVNLYSKPV